MGVVTKELEVIKHFAVLDKTRAAVHILEYQLLKNFV